MAKRIAIESTAEAYLELLAARGVEYLFANAGTDFAPIIEAYAKRGAQGQALPRPITVPHEVPAVAMAHGYAMVTRRAQAVMVHVIVGAANALGGVINAARAQVPILFSAGRTPLSEGGVLGSRDRHIHWAQESYDQAGMAREFVKWDYELRNFAQIETVVDRALAMAQAEPPGPVYLTLPREVLAERHETFEYAEPSRLQRPGLLRPAPADIDDAAQLLAGARNPIIITKAAGRDPLAVPTLVKLAETLGAPVFQDPGHNYMNFPGNHPLHAGYDAAAHLEEADVILVVEADAPWYPHIKSPRPETRVIQVASDPLFSGYPIRGFPSDLTLGGAPRLTLEALAEAAARLVDPRAVAERRRLWETEHTRLRQAWAARAKAVSKDAPIDMAWVSRCIADRVDEQTLVVNEYDLDTTQTSFQSPGTYFAASPSSGLGWGLGAALGAKLAAPDKTLICCVGDGAYIFGSPTAAHWVSRAHDLPVLFVIFNNRAWNAVKRSVTSMVKDGWAARTGNLVLSELDPAPEYQMVCEASGGYGERVEDPAELPKALERALHAVKVEKRQALLNVICKKPTP
jgi:acetolactate synthase-1/2/3 large subunit